MRGDLRNVVAGLRAAADEIREANRVEAIARGKVLVNFLAAHTPPANGRMGKDAGSAAQVIRYGKKKLKGRIEWNFLGSRGRAPKGEVDKKKKGRFSYRKGRVTQKDGEVVVINRRGWAPLPFIETMAGSDVQGEPAEGFLRKTFFKKRRSAMWRVTGVAKDELWPVPMGSLKKLMVSKQKNVGGMIAGWLPAAIKLGMKNVSHLKGGTRRTVGSATITDVRGYVNISLRNGVEYVGDDGFVMDHVLVKVVELKAQNNFRHRDVHFKKKLDRIQRKAMKS